MNYLKHSMTALLCLRVIHLTQSKQLSVKVDLSLILYTPRIQLWIWEDNLVPFPTQKQLFGF